MSDRRGQIEREIKAFCEKLAVAMPEIAYVEHCVHLPSGSVHRMPVAYVRQEKVEGAVHVLPHPELRISPEAVEEMDWGILRYRIARALAGNRSSRNMMFQFIILGACSVVVGATVGVLGVTAMGIPGELAVPVGLLSALVFWSVATAISVFRSVRRARKSEVELLDLTGENQAALAVARDDMARYSNALPSTQKTADRFFDRHYRWLEREIARRAEV